VQAVSQQGTLWFQADAKQRMMDQVIHPTAHVLLARSIHFMSAIKTRMGVPEYDDRRYSEKFVLEGFRPPLGITIAPAGEFSGRSTNFEPGSIARYTPARSRS